MLKKYRMPNGRIFQFEDNDAPKEAVPVEMTAEKKSVPANKAKLPKNKAVRK